MTLKQGPKIARICSTELKVADPPLKLTSVPWSVGPVRSRQRRSSGRHRTRLLLALWVGLGSLVFQVSMASALGIFSFEEVSGASDPPAHSSSMSDVVIACDFDSSGQCDVLDLDLMYSQGDLVASVTVGADNMFDLNADLSIDNLDLDMWLAGAATANGYPSPYLRGDTDDLTGPGLCRDVDITDFNQLAANFDPAGANAASNTWGNANFDGDNDIDVTDFNSLAANVSPGGYGKIPEPTTVHLVIVGLGSVILLLPFGRRFFMCRRGQSV